MIKSDLVYKDNTGCNLCQLWGNKSEGCNQQVFIINEFLMSFQSTIIAATYYFLSQLGEPARKRRRKDEDDINLLYQTNFIDRQGFNPLDAVTGFLDPILSYSAVFRTLVFYGLGVRTENKFYYSSYETFFSGIRNFGILGFHVIITKLEWEKEEEGVLGAPLKEY